MNTLKIILTVKDYEMDYDINPPHLQRLNYNPNYYSPNEEDLLIGDDIVIGVYASHTDGSPTIRWIETVVKGLPLRNYYTGYVTCKKFK